MVTPVAIATSYQGETFRSRLEAEWAFNLDAARIVWCYEPEGFTLPSGARYLPDFWLPEINAWLEIKGPGVAGLEKTREFAFYKQYRPECRKHAWRGPGHVTECHAEGCEYARDDGGCGYWFSDAHAGGRHETSTCCGWQNPHEWVLVGHPGVNGRMQCIDANLAGSPEDAPWGNPVSGRPYPHGGFSSFHPRTWKRLPQWMPR